MRVSRKNRLLSVALIHVHYGMEVNRERAAAMFLQIHPRKMALEKCLVMQSRLGTNKS